MAYCQNCGNEVRDDEKFCPACGASLNENETNIEIQNENSVPKCFTIFGKIGYILGIITISICLIPALNILTFEVGPVGIVFSCLGKKDSTLASKTKIGLILSIIGTVLVFIMYIINAVVFALNKAL